jgi:hypothetical protein
MILHNLPKLEHVNDPYPITACCGFAAIDLPEGDLYTFVDDDVTCEKQRSCELSELRCKNRNSAIEEDTKTSYRMGIGEDRHIVFEHKTEDG